jgi:hypothetical protein
MVSVPGFDHLLKAYDITDLLDDIASSDPPAYLRRCFAEGDSAPYLSWPRVQQLAACAMVLDAVVNGRDYPGFEPELIADWRQHYAATLAKLRQPACAALRRIIARDAAAIAADQVRAAPASPAGAPDPSGATVAAATAATPGADTVAEGGADAAPAVAVEAELRELERRLEA